MYTNGEKGSADSAAKRSDMVGVERAWPVLFWVMGVLGFVLPKRRPSGHYGMSWVRLIPMMIITSALSWYVLTNKIQFTNNSYDLFVDLLVYSACYAVIATTFALAILKRRETCLLFEGLDGKLDPSRGWLSLAWTLLFLLDAGLFLIANFNFVNGYKLLPYSWIIMTVLYPILPLLLDFHVAASISALNQVYARMLNQILRQGDSSSWPRCSVEELQSLSTPAPFSFSATTYVSNLFP